MNSSIKLTKELEGSILAGIRAGGYPHVAAQAFGVPEELFAKWIASGSKKNAKDPYKTFCLNVQAAKAQARLKAEMKAMEEDPRFWLKNGPGKEKPDSPGWAAMVRPMIGGNTNTINLFGSPDFIQFMATLRNVLAPFPQALDALSRALDGKPQEPVQMLPAIESVPPSE